jgi:hypothetical protein
MKSVGIDDPSQLRGDLITDNENRIEFERQLES